MVWHQEGKESSKGSRASMVKPSFTGTELAGGSYSAAKKKRVIKLRFQPADGPFTILGVY